MLILRRTATDSAPTTSVTWASRRLLRIALDAAPACDGGVQVVVTTFESQVGIRLAELDFQYEIEGLIEARGPPLGSTP